MCGATVPTGAEWEPVLLNVVRPNLREDGDRDEVGGGSECEEGRGGFENGGPGLKREARGFAGAATLGEVREELGEPEECLLCQEHKGGKRAEQGAGEGGGASGWRVFPPDDMQRTLKELSLKDGDALLVLEPQSLDSRYTPLPFVCCSLCVCVCFTTVFLMLLSMFALNGDVVTVTTPSDCRWLQVEFVPQKAGEGEEEEEMRKIKVPATGNMVIMYFILFLTYLVGLFISYLLIERHVVHSDSYFQLLCEVKQRALEELQLPPPPAGKMLGLHNISWLNQHVLCVFHTLDTS